ncbi:hypothetical protein M1446_02295 [Candidatus Dependentiae bacterium]|nr:hypothetical protein [Candidatus Dependentiae bacterium]
MKAFLKLLLFLFYSTNCLAMQTNDNFNLEGLKNKIGEIEINPHGSIQENFDKYLCRQIFQIIKIWDFKERVQNLIAVKIGNLIHQFYSIEQINEAYVQTLNQKEVFGMISLKLRKLILLNAGAEEVQISTLVVINEPGDSPENPFKNLFTSFVKNIQKRRTF